MSIHEEAKRLLKLFEFDEKRTNDMAARTLLSLLNLREEIPGIKQQIIESECVV